MKIEFDGLPEGIKRHYLSAAQITRVDVYNTTVQPWYKITFANGTVREWHYEYPKIGSKRDTKRWLMSTGVA